MKLYRIILVDDEEEIRKSIIRKIKWEENGFLVAGDAENGEDALEKIELLEPDLILTDIRMPYMDGLTLAERVRQKYPSMKIVIFSGYDDFEYAKQAIKCYRIHTKAGKRRRADCHFTKDKGKSGSGDRTEAKCKPFAGKLYKKPADPPGTVFK